MTKKATKKPSERDLRDAGFECPDMASASERLGVGDLTVLLEDSKRLAAAWDRGQLLRRVRDVASTTVVVPARADKLLGLEKGSFERIYKTDRIARELWDRGRYEILVEIERALVARVKDGDLKAVAAVEHLFTSRGEPTVTDFNCLSPTQMELATGFPRQTILRWVKKNGLPRNADGSYDLPAFVAWFGKWERDKVTGGKEAAGLNPMQAEKARMYRLQADEAEGRLWERAIVIRMLRDRAARMVQVFSEARAREWSTRHEGQTAAQLLDAYLEVFRQVRSVWGQWPAELPLPEGAKAKIEEGLQILLATESTEKGTADGTSCQ